MSMEWKELPVSTAASYDASWDTIIRQSTINQFQLCPMRVGLAKHKNFLAPVNEKMAFGTCVHYLAEQDLVASTERLDLLTNMGEWVEPILVEQYDWSLSQVSDPVSFFSELGVAYRTWRQQVQPLMKNSIAIESEMWLPLGEGLGECANENDMHPTIWLKGTPDAVYEDRIVDLKTSGKAWAQAKADLSIQASLYMSLAKQELDIGIKKFTFHVYDRSKSRWDILETTRTVPQINAALLTAYNYVLQHEAQIYPATVIPEANFNKKRGWYCQPYFCGAWNVCDSKYINDGYDYTKVAIRAW